MPFASTDMLSDVYFTHSKYFFMAILHTCINSRVTNKRELV